MVCQTNEICQNYPCSLYHELDIADVGYSLSSLDSGHIFVRHLHDIQRFLMVAYYANAEFVVCTLAWNRSFYQLGQNIAYFFALWCSIGHAESILLVGKYCV